MSMEDILIDDELADFYLNSPNIAILIKPLGENSIEIIKEELCDENCLIPKRTETLAIVPIEEMEKWIKKIKVRRNDIRRKF